MPQDIIDVSLTEGYLQNWLLFPYYSIPQQVFQFEEKLPTNKELLVFYSKPYSLKSSLDHNQIFGKLYFLT